MDFNVLVASRNDKWVEEVSSGLNGSGFGTSSVSFGADVQREVFNRKFVSVILDVTIRRHSAFEVLRYLKTNKPNIAVILFFPSKEHFKDLELSKKELRALGVSDILIHPIAVEKIVQSVEGQCQFESWQNVAFTSKLSEESEVVESDVKFTRIPIDEIHMGSTMIFDLYVRLKKDRYVKILELGDFFEKERIEAYKLKEVEFLYFKTQDRAKYINFMNKVIVKAINLSQVQAEKKLSLFKNTADKVVETILSEGLKPKIIEECSTFCLNMGKLVEKDNEISAHMRNLELIDPEIYTHTFLVSFFSVLINKNLEWGSSRTAEIVGFAGLIHDLGKIKLSPNVNYLRPEAMTKKQLEEYKEHPSLGVELLQNFSHIKEPIRQAIYQHHELVDGSGFPNGLPGIRIYPMAKILAVADRFTHILLEERVSLKKALELFVLDKEIIKLYDHEVVKALIKGFIEKNERK